ncbi:MAG: protein kinase [Deltaproteobacteria bacterium]|nr:protein kinase [Deltaproteobacteria bacterium]
MNDTPQIGDLLAGRYRIERLLGSGSMGTVYLAEHTILGRHVAIKLLHRALVYASDMRLRFRREARALCRVDHAGVPTIYDYGENDNGFPYLVMEYISGGSLSDLIDAGHIAFDRVLPILIQIAEALDAAHRRGVLHRDLKPANVLLAPHTLGSARVKVTDFGLAKLLDGDHSYNTTRDGAIFGTPHYMAPEQFAVHGPVDARIDLYAFGVTAFQTLTGELPFSGENLVAIATAHVNQPPVAPSTIRGDIPATIDAIVLRCLAKRPEARYASASDIAMALRQIGATTSLSLNGTLAAFPTNRGATLVATPSFLPTSDDASLPPPTASEDLRALAILVRSLRERHLGDGPALLGHLANYAEADDAVRQAEGEVFRLALDADHVDRLHGEREAALHLALIEVERELTSSQGSPNTPRDPESQRAVDRLAEHLRDLATGSTIRLTRLTQDLDKWREELANRQARAKEQRQALATSLRKASAASLDAELMTLFALAHV